MVSLRISILSEFGPFHMSSSIGTDVAGILGFRTFFLLGLKIDYRDGRVDAGNLGRHQELHRRRRERIVRPYE